MTRVARFLAIKQGHVIEFGVAIRLLAQQRSRNPTTITCTKPTINLEFGLQIVTAAILTLATGFGTRFSNILATATDAVNHVLILELEPTTVVTTTIVPEGIVTVLTEIGFGKIRRNHTDTKGLVTQRLVRFVEAGSGTCHTRVRAHRLPTLVKGTGGPSGI